MIVIPDTNFLIYAIKHKINIDYELDRILTNYEVVILNCIKEELETLKAQLKGREKFSINLILSLIERYKSENYNIGKYADEIIINYAKCKKDNGHKIIVCTNDKDLKKRLIDMDIPVIFVKQKNYFELQGNLH